MDSYVWMIPCGVLVVASTVATLASARADQFLGTHEVVALDVLSLAISPTIEIKSAQPLDISLSARPVDNAVKIGIGNQIAFCPILACVVEPSGDHQRATLLLAATTHDDMHSEEQTLAVTTVIDKGALKSWAPNTAFVSGDNVAFSGTRNSVYRALRSGNSESFGEGPVGKGAQIRDGTVVWEWINDAAIAAKVGAYVETVVKAGAGAAWGAAFNYHLLPGAVPSFDPGVEFDYSNESGKDCVLGVADCSNLRIAAGGPNRITTNLAVVSDNRSSYAALWGLRLNGDFLASDAVIEVDASSQVGLAFGRSGIGGASHSVATIEDVTTSPTSLSIGGHKSIAGIVEHSTAPNGIALNGTYSGAQIVGNAFILGPSGDVSAASISETAPKAPRLSSSPCLPGQHAWDTNYEYRCVATNTWRRAALSAF